MTDRKTLVKDALAGRLHASIPTGFWFHFPPEKAHGNEAIRAQAEFFRETGVDLVKVMNENLHPCTKKVETVADWRHFRPLEMKSPEVRDQLEIISRTVDALGDDAIVLTTIHGLIASAFHASGRVDDYEAQRGFLAANLREAPDVVRPVFASIADSMAEFAEASLKAGAQGIYYAALGGEASVFTDEEFADVIAPAEQQILAAAQSADAFNVLHICKEDIVFDRYRDYDPDVVSWSIGGTGIGLDKGREIFPRATILGGVDNTAAALLNGSPQDAAALAKNALDSLTTHENFILGADCTLPTDTPLENIRAMTDVAHAYSPRA